MARTYRAAMLGVGPRGLQQAQAYRRHPRVRLVAICDIDDARRTVAAQEFGLGAEHAYTDLRRMLDVEKPDIVNIPTRTDLHAPLTIAVLTHRPPKALVVEKPMATSLDDADRMLALAKTASTVLAVSHQSRTTPPFIVAERMIAQGQIGPLTGVAIRGNGYYGGYDMFNIGTHSLSAARRFVGTAHSVSATLTTAGRRTGVDGIVTGPAGFGLLAGENIQAQYEFDGGRFAAVEFHRRSEPSPYWVFDKIYGEDGALCVYHRDQLYVRRGRDWDMGAVKWEPVALEPPDRILHGVDYAVDPDGDFWMAEETVQALDGTRVHQCRGEEGLGVTEMMFGVYASHFTGRRIDFPMSRGHHPLVQALEAGGLPLPDGAPGELRYREWLPRELARIGVPH